MLTLIFFFNDTATTEIYTLSLHDALPICPVVVHTNTEEMVAVAIKNPLTIIASDAYWQDGTGHPRTTGTFARVLGRDRKSTRLNSSHLVISYAVFCLKKKK